VLASKRPRLCWWCTRKIEARTGQCFINPRHAFEEPGHARNGQESSPVKVTTQNQTSTKPFMKNTLLPARRVGFVALSSSPLQPRGETRALEQYVVPPCNENFRPSSFKLHSVREGSNVQALNQGPKSPSHVHHQTRYSMLIRFCKAPLYMYL